MSSTTKTRSKPQTELRALGSLTEERTHGGSTAECLRGYVPDYPRDLLTSVEFKRAVRWSLDQLAPPDRELLYLRFVDLLTWAETARRLGLKDRDAAQYKVEGKGESRPGPVVRHLLAMAEARLAVEQDRSKMDRLTEALVGLLRDEKAKAA